MSLFPEVHALGKTLTDIFGASDSWGGLKDGGDEDERTFRVPFTGSNTAEFKSKNREKTSSYFT
jgi:hypothetical protein